jgi:hypothetical protein
MVIKVDDIINNIEQAMQDYGRDLTLRTVDEGTYDPTTGSTTGDSTSDFTFRGLLHAFKFKDLQDSNILDTDRKCIVSVDGFSPLPDRGDQVVVGSTVYSIVAIKEYELQGTVFGYVFHLRIT